MMFSVVDEFHGKYALEPLFSALCEIHLGKYKICKTLCVFMFSFGSKVLMKVDVIDCQHRHIGCIHR